MQKLIETATRTVVLSGAVILGACQAGGVDSAQNAPLDTDNQKASYAIGLQFGANLLQVKDHVEMASLVRGLQDAIAEKEPVIAEADLQEAMQRFQQMLMEEQNAAMAENQQAGEAYLAENAEKDGVTTTASGLQYEILREGDGPKPTPEDQVTIHYRGTLLDGTEFDSSYGGDPATFPVAGVITGFSEGLQLMSVGSQYRFVIPGALAYGEQGPPGIPPNATLIFEVEMIGIAE
jgi:FKBP-type peptidyl-prolyl cis-trans isomerase FkpA